MRGQPGRHSSFSISDESPKVLAADSRVKVPKAVARGGVQVRGHGGGGGDGVKAAQEFHLHSRRERVLDGKEGQHGPGELTSVGQEARPALGGRGGLRNWIGPAKRVV